MKCINIHEHFRNYGSWLNWDNTTDGFKTGNPEREVHIIAVAWKPSWEALKEAYNRGAELFIAHESICAKAVNKSRGSEIEFALESEKPKFDWLQKNGMVVYRCHDFWDSFPEHGIRWAWQRGLDLGNKIITDDYPLLVTQIDPIPLADLANHILKKVKLLGQNGILVTGDMGKKISTIATGTGVTGNPEKMFQLGADAGILTDDYYTHVRMGILAHELNFPTIIVNHGVSEEWGIKNLASYIMKMFPDQKVFHIPQYCPYFTMV
jgi:putative NIF3 family GTP cyclohydrolase 1 type 2